MRITDNYKKGKKVTGSSSLREAIETAPKVRGVYTISVGSSKKYIGTAENGLREKFIELYNGFHLGEDQVAIKTYENRDEVTVEWVQETDIVNTEEYIKDLSETEKFEWM